MAPTSGDTPVLWGPERRRGAVALWRVGAWGRDQP